MLKPKIKSAVRALIRKPFSSIGLSDVGGLATILTYHRVLPDGLHLSRFVPNLPLSVSLKNFTQQMKFVSENYACLSLSDLVQSLEKGTLQSRSVAVTFDDGYRDNIDLALPVLKQYGVPATLYLTTGLMDGALESFWWDEIEEIIRARESIEFYWGDRWVKVNTSGFRNKRRAFKNLHDLFRYAPPAELHRCLGELRSQSRLDARSFSASTMTWDDVLRLAEEPLITIGAHTVSHPVLSLLDGAALGAELSESRKVLEAKLGRPVHHMAFPFGDRESASEREYRAARSAGYQSAVTTLVGQVQCFHRDHLHALPRMGVTFKDDFAHFTWKLSGFESWIKRPKSLFIADSEG